MPSNQEIAHQEKLLAMYRGLLAEHLRQRAAWDRFDVPEYIRGGIASLRQEITDVKGILRGWGIAVADHPDDVGPEDKLAGQAQHQRELLNIHRGNLAIVLRQQEQFGPGQAPPVVVNTLRHERAEIQRIKAILRGWGVPVDDLPAEE